MIRRAVHLAAGTASACFAVHAHAQSATVRLSHDQVSGTVLPGATIRIACTVSWTGAVQLARISGDALATPDVGAASGPGSASLGAGPLINYGSPALGSILGADIGSGPPAGFWIQPFWMSSPVTFLEFDWTAPSTPGVVAFDWRARPDLPDAQFYPLFASTSYSPLPTTYLGTSITVIPTPASAAPLALAGAIAFRRRRRR